MQDAHSRSVSNRLRTARGHLDAVLRMVEEDAACPGVMKQLSAVQGSLATVSRLVLRNHLEICVAEAIRSGLDAEVVEEIMEALRYERSVTGPTAELTPAPDRRNEQHAWATPCRKRDPGGAPPVELL